MNKKHLPDIEKELLLEAILAVYGYDFRHYARASLKRRLENALSIFKLTNYSQLQELLLHDETAFNQFLLGISITVTEMFRDPGFYLTLRNEVLPVLKTYPYFKVWHAGCATGEEVYSVAICLHEAGLLSRATIYATDINPEALKQAKKGIYEADVIQKYIENYEESGGKAHFSDYFYSKYGSVKMRDFLKKRMTFATHNLVTDKVFGEMNIIFCRNVVIYFNTELQDRVLQLFNDSLCHLGFLCLGSRETLDFSSVSSTFERISTTEKIYRKKG